MVEHEDCARVVARVAGVPLVARAERAWGDAHTRPLSRDEPPRLFAHRGDRSSCIGKLVRSGGGRQ